MNTIKIEFDFNDRKSENLEQLNALLAAMELEELELDDLSGYLAVTEDGEGNLLHKRYGLDSGTLRCKPRAGGDRYQLDTVVVSDSVDHDEYVTCWRQTNPDRIIRTVITIGFNEDNAYVIAHHRRRG